jgi:hypothetical protein
MTDVDMIWKRIEMHAGETFRLVRGSAFTYVIKGNAIVPDRTGYPIHRGNIKKAVSRLPLFSTMDVQDLRGPSCVYAIMMDRRIRGSDW